MSRFVMFWIFVQYSYVSIFLLPFATTSPQYCEYPVPLILQVKICLPYNNKKARDTFGTQEQTVLLTKVVTMASIGGRYKLGIISKLGQLPKLFLIINMVPMGA